MAADILPNGIVESNFILSREGSKWFPLFCVNCGKQSPYLVRETYLPQQFGFYLCDHPCVEKYGAPAGAMIMPDQVFWKRVADIQQEEFGHVLTMPELAAELEKPGSLMSKLETEARG